MKVVVIYAHPYEKSFNNALLSRTIVGLEKGGNVVDLIDLYQDGFNPVLTEEHLLSISKNEVKDSQVLDYQKRLEEADHLVFIFPIWFVILPAILKGFVDKVFTKGWAYDTPEGKKFPEGMLTHLSATVISTMGTPSFLYKLFCKNAMKYVLINGTLKFSGIKKVKWINIGYVQATTNEKRLNWLNKVEQYLQAV